MSHCKEFLRQLESQVEDDYAFNPFSFFNVNYPADPIGVPRVPVTGVEPVVTVPSENNLEVEVQPGDVVGVNGPFFSASEPFLTLMESMGLDDPDEDKSDDESEVGASPRASR